jgi:ankyrin repeat protein
MRSLIAMMILAFAAPAAAITLPDALARGSGAAVAAALAGGADPDMMLADGRTPLVWAVQEDKVAVARTLLAYGADANKPSNLIYGMTALMAASAAPQMEITALLIESGADVNRVDTNGDPVINWAAYYGHEDLVAVLLNAGASPDIATQHGAVLHIALRRGHREVVDLLIQRRLTGPALEGREGLVLNDVLSGDAGSLNRRLEYASADTLDPAGTPMLVLAAWSGNTTIVDVLLQNDGYVDAVDAIGFTAFSHASREGNLSVMQRLLDAGADVDHVGADIGMGLTPLMLAAGAGEVETTLQLVSIGANLAALNTSGQNAALWALVTGQRETVDILIAAGSPLDIVDSEGNTMLSVARSFGYDDLVAQLNGLGVTQ